MARGIVAERLMTDNAFTYIHNKTLKTLLRARGIAHLRIRPYTPRTNGKVERLTSIGPSVKQLTMPTATL